MLHRRGPCTRVGTRKEPQTPYLRFGDRMEIEMRDAEGRSIFGAIEQRVVQYAA